HPYALALFSVSPPTSIPPLSLHDALPIYFHASGGFMPLVESTSVVNPPPPSPPLLAPIGTWRRHIERLNVTSPGADGREQRRTRSEEHTSELQSRFDLVCRLLLEKKKHHT